MASDLIDLIKTRRSVRSYKADPVPQELLDTVLEAGTYAPTGGGHQSPVIVAVTSPETRERLRALNAAVMGKETDPYYGAPAIVVVLADGGRGTFVEDGSCVLENLMLAAHAVGLSSCWIHREARRSSRSGAFPRRCAAWAPSRSATPTAPSPQLPRARRATWCACSSNDSHVPERGALPAASMLPAKRPLSACVAKDESSRCSRRGASSQTPGRRGSRSRCGRG